MVLLGRHLIAQISGVSRETLSDLDTYAEGLIQWQNKINLVSSSTLNHIWDRHLLDSAQLILYGQEHKIWLDIGSGGGLPGLVIAILLKTRLDSHIHLIESNHKKAAFLQHMIQKLNLPAILHVSRAEYIIPKLGQIDVVTARAFAPLSDLLHLCNPLLITGSIGLFPKGRDVELELTEAQKWWQFKYRLHASQTDNLAHIAEIWMSSE